jgi:hypothetical protein
LPAVMPHTLVPVWAHFARREVIPRRAIGLVVSRQQRSEVIVAGRRGAPSGGTDDGVLTARRTRDALGARGTSASDCGVAFGGGVRICADAAPLLRSAPPNRMRILCYRAQRAFPPAPRIIDQLRAWHAGCRAVSSWATVGGSGTDWDSEKSPLKLHLDLPKCRNLQRGDARVNRDPRVRITLVDVSLFGPNLR